MGDFGQRAEADGPDGSRPDASTMQGSAKPWYLATDVSNSPSDPGRQRPHRGGASRGPRVWDQRTRLNVRSVTGPRHRCQHEEATWQERLPAARTRLPDFGCGRLCRPCRSCSCRYSWRSGQPSSRNDSARSAQVAWAIVLTVVGLGPLALRGRTGTTMCDEGLRRHFLFHVVQLRWEDIEGFSDERAFARTRGVSRTSVVAVRVRARPPVASIAVPSELHTTSSDKARALAEYLNRYFRHDTVDGASDIDSAVDDNSAVRTKWSRISRVCVARSLRAVVHADFDRHGTAGVG